MENSQQIPPQKRSRLLTILIPSVLVILAFAGLSLYSARRSQKPSPTSTPTPTQDASIEDEFPSSPEETGAVAEEEPDKPNPALEQFYALMDKAPISTENFTIEPDYDAIKLVATIKPPFNLNLQLFLNWLEENGYGQISQEDIVYDVLPAP